MGIQLGIWRGGLSSVASQGFGRANFGSGVPISSHNYSPAANSLIANTPQILVSYIYLAYNNLATHMLASAELISYSTSRRHLRVAFSRGQQRSRKFLQIPYKYGVPIMTASILLHWLISQSLYLVRITFYDYRGISQPDYLISTVQYSPYAIIFALCMGGVMLLAMFALGFGRRFSPTMPLAACCSASLAALSQPYHGRMTEEDVTMKKLQWGDVQDRGNQTEEDENDRVAHACFSAGKVVPLVVGRTYA